VTHDLELKVIIHDLKMCRYYLLSRRFMLIGDHSGLRYLFDQTNINGKHVRWLATLIEFDFKIRYIRGKEKDIADALGRRV